MKPEDQKELIEYMEALASYSGNKLTNYNPFQRLMIEEKINIIADAVCCLIKATVGEKK